MGVFRLSLRTAIAVPFALLFAATVALQAVTQQRQISHLIDEESVRLLDALTATSRNRLVEFLDEPFRIQRDIADAIGRHALYKPGDMRPIYDHLRGVYKDLYLDRHQISLLSFGSEAGDYAGMRREAAGFKLILKDGSTGGMMNVYQDDTPGTVSAAFPGYDPRERPWYAPVARSGRAAWSAIYTTAGERGDVTISASTPVRVGTELVGVAEADVRLDSLNQFLRNESLRGKGLIFITDQGGRLVAHSEVGSVVTQAVSQGAGAFKRSERLLMSESATPAIRAAAHYVQQAPLVEGRAFRLTEGAEMYFGRVTPYADARGIDWRIVALVPESDLLGDARQASRRAMLMVVGIALLGLLLGLWIIQRVTRPILMTAEAANKLARGEWNSGIDKSSSLQETTILLRAFNEMSDRLQLSFNQMREQLMYDSLTQLLTRRGLLEQAAWTEPKRAVLTLVGLDAFRAINDSVGHGTGDRLLHAVSERMRERIATPVLMARLGGDEFAVLHLDVDGEYPEVRIGETVLALFSSPYSSGADEVMVNASVGVVGGILRADGLSEWLRNASIALGEAKRRGRGHCVVFEADMMEQSVEHARLVSELRQALEKEQLLVHYQPVVNLATGQIDGAEALVRWKSPTRGMVPPGIFIPVAEESDLILALGEWVLRNAIKDIAERMPQLPPDFDLHVNVSARQLIQSDFADTLQNALQSNGMHARHLTLELTESILVGHDEITEDRLRKIRALGVKIAIDDFGTGYSSLAYLSRLPFDCLKIDQSFVRNLSKSPQDAAIVTAILHMAQGFGVTVVAEGVETEAEARRLREMGCAYAQGYWFGRPGPLAQLALASAG